MTDVWPLVVIMLLTYQRVDYAIRAIRSTREKLYYPTLKWFVADNGSEPKQLQQILDEIGENDLLGHVSIPSPEGTYHSGKCWNTATMEIYNHADILVRLEDDWAVREVHDIRPYAKLLRTQDDIGMVRLGYQHDKADMRVVCYAGHHYLEYLKSTAFVHGGHPCLVHRRYHEIYGLYHTERNPGEIEMEFDERMRKINGPRVLRPMEIGGWGLYEHYGREKAYK